MFDSAIKFLKNSFSGKWGTVLAFLAPIVFLSFFRRLFLSPISFLPLGVRRFYYSPSVYRLRRVLFSWGALLAVGMVACLLLNPLWLEQRFPNWRGSVGYVVFGIAVLALMGNLFRFFKIVFVSGFWLFAAYLVGKEVFYRSDLSAPAVNGRITASQAALAPASVVPINPDKTVGLFDETAKSPGVGEEIPAPWSSWGLFRPFKRLREVFSGILYSVESRIRRWTSGVNNTVSSGISGVGSGLASVGSDLQGELGDLLNYRREVGQDLIDYSPDELASADLPGNAYFPPSSGGGVEILGYKLGKKNMCHKHGPFDRFSRLNPR